MSGEPTGRFSGWAGTTMTENPPSAQGRRRSLLAELPHDPVPVRWWLTDRAAALGPDRRIMPQTRGVVRTPQEGGPHRVDALLRLATARTTPRSPEPMRNRRFAAT